MSREKFGDAGCNAFGVGKCEQDGVPAIVMAIHTFGEYLDFHPHLHALVADGLFDREGKFHVMRADENGGDVDAHFIGNHAALAVVVSRACDFIAAITQHIPDKRFQMVRYYGWYSNKMRGQRRKREEEKIANGSAATVRESAAIAEQGCGAKVSTAIEIIEHLAPKPRRIPSRSWRELIQSSLES